MRRASKASSRSARGLRSELQVFSGFIRAAAVTSASHPGGRMLRQVTDRQNTGSEVWANSAYRSQSNEAWLSERMLTSRIHRRKPKGKPMPTATARANAVKSALRARIEHVFAHQKNRFGLFIHTIGIARAEAKLTLANLAHNFDPPDLPREASRQALSPSAREGKRLILA